MCSTILQQSREFQSSWLTFNPLPLPSTKSNSPSFATQDTASPSVAFMSLRLLFTAWLTFWKRIGSQKTFSTALLSLSTCLDTRTPAIRATKRQRSCFSRQKPGRKLRQCTTNARAFTPLSFSLSAAASNPPLSLRSLLPAQMEHISQASAGGVAPPMSHIQIL
jgi:hypothetical protein